MKPLRNLAPFRWWRARHALPLVVHGPQTRIDWMCSEMAASIERTLYGEPRTPTEIRDMAARVDRAFWGLDKQARDA